MKKKMISIIMCAAILIGAAMPAAAARIPARVTGVTATSCPDTHTVAVEWQPVEGAESYQLQISRSFCDWRRVDSYTTTGARTKYYATFNYKSEHRIVDYSECDTYYVRVRAIINGRAAVWSCPVKTKLVERKVNDNPAGNLIVSSLESLESAINTMNNLYKPTWGDPDD